MHDTTKKSTSKLEIKSVDGAFQPRSQGHFLFVIGKAGNGPGTGRSRDLKHSDMLGVLNYNELSGSIKQVKMADRSDGFFIVLQRLQIALSGCNFPSHCLKPLQVVVTWQRCSYCFSDWFWEVNTRPASSQVLSCEGRQ